MIILGSVIGLLTILLAPFGATNGGLPGAYWALPFVIFVTATVTWRGAVIYSLLLGIITLLFPFSGYWRWILFWPLVAVSAQLIFKYFFRQFNWAAVLALTILEAVFLGSLEIGSEVWRFVKLESAFPWRIELWSWFKLLVFTGVVLGTMALIYQRFTVAKRENFLWR